jgi:beta-glucanase (GH16 family)
MVENGARMIAVGTALGLVCWFAPALAGPPPTGVWEFVPELSDEFNAPHLDTGKWTTQHRHYLGRKPGLIQPQNVAVKGGLLNLWVEQGVPKGTPSWYQYTTGYVQSRQTLLYGYVEVRAKPPKSATDSGLWLYRWSETGTFEIDVCEIAPRAKGHERVIHTNAHVYLGPPHLENDTNRISDPQSWPAPFDPAEDFHHYGLAWDALSLRYYVDGKLIREKPNTHWDQPMEIRLTIEVIPEWMGLPDPASLKEPYQVDYLRVWRRK